MEMQESRDIAGSHLRFVMSLFRSVTANAKVKDLRKGFAFHFVYKMRNTAQTAAFHHAAVSQA